MLGEFDRKSPPGRAMQARQKALNHSFGQQLQTGQAGGLQGVEQVEPGAGLKRGARAHGGRNVLEGAVVSQRAVSLSDGQDSAAVRALGITRPKLLTRRKIGYWDPVAYPLPLRYAPAL